MNISIFFCLFISIVSSLVNYSSIPEGSWEKSKVTVLLRYILPTFMGIVPVIIFLASFFDFNLTWKFLGFFGIPSFLMALINETKKKKINDLN